MAGGQISRHANPALPARASFANSSPRMRHQAKPRRDLTTLATSRSCRFAVRMQMAARLGRAAIRTIAADQAFTSTAFPIPSAAVGWRDAALPSELPFCAGTGVAGVSATIFIIATISDVLALPMFILVSILVWDEPRSSQDVMNSMSENRIAQ